MRATQEITPNDAGGPVRFPSPLMRARFLRREKRFLIHAETAEGRPVVAHTNNTGRMTGCLVPDGAIWLSPAANPRRKLKWSLEIVESADGVPIGVNTALANALVAEAIADGRLPALDRRARLRREVAYETGNSRVDILLESDEQQVWVEVKNVSLASGGKARFPDAPTARGRKHLRDLSDQVRAGQRAALVFCSQRPDVTTVGPADEIDPEYGRLLRQVARNGVEIYGLGCRVSPRGIEACRHLTIDLTGPD